MSDCLTIQVIEKQKPIATIYYHWSGLAGKAMEETKALRDFITNYQGDDLRLGLIRFVENCGGCITGGGQEEWKKASELYPGEHFKVTGDYNYGLIDIFPEDMKKAMDCSYKTIDINVDKKEIRFGVMHEWENADTYNQNPLSLDVGLRDGSINMFLDKRIIPHIDLDPYHLTFDELDLLDQLFKMVGTGFRQLIGFNGKTVTKPGFVFENNGRIFAPLE